MKSSLRIKKFALSDNDDRRIIGDDDIQTFAHGHFGSNRWEIRGCEIFSQVRRWKFSLVFWNQGWIQNVQELYFEINLDFKVNFMSCL